MDKRLLAASQTGNTRVLHHLLDEDPLLLHRIALTSAENPLHVASAAGHIGFAKEILRLKPDFARQVNQDGFSPLHLASANGYLEIVRELLKVDRGISRVQGRNNWTPLHFAASRGNSDVIKETLLSCPESMEDVTAQKESALHVAVKGNQFEAIDVMLRWLCNTNKDEMLNMRDELGNSVLHIATWKKNRQVLEWLLGSNRIVRKGTQEVNAVNKSGLTPLDLLLIFPSEAGDREIEELLRNAGAKRAKDIVLPHSLQLESNTNLTQTNNNLESNAGDDLVEYFKFKKGRDTPSDVRTALLVMAVLVATATFQVGVNPPSGIWQDSNPNGNSTAPAQIAGRSILGSYNSATYLIFVVFNSTGLSVSLYMLRVLTSDFPLQLEFQICVIALYFTYYIAVGFMAPDGSKLFITIFSAVVPASIFYLVKLFRLLVMILMWVFTKLLHCARYILFEH